MQVICSGFSGMFSESSYSDSFSSAEEKQEDQDEDEVEDDDNEDDEKDEEERCRGGGFCFEDVGGFLNRRLRLLITFFLPSK